MVALGKVKRSNLNQKESPNAQYFCFSGITPLTPPLGFGVSPCLLGIIWIWQWKMVWPAALPMFIPILKPVIVSSKILNSVLVYLAQLESHHVLLESIENNLQHAS